MNEATIIIPKNAFNARYMPYLRNDSRYLVLYGGAGSGKSYFAVERYIVKLLEKKLCNILVVRQYANSNRNSTFALFMQVITKWGMARLFTINKGEMRIICKRTGNTVIFAGLDDVEKLKSDTFKGGDMTDIWVEEASETSESDINQLDVRLRGIGTKKQIVLTFNPIDIKHWLKKRFIDFKSEKITFLHTTYKDNAFLDDAYRELLESFKTTDNYYYTVYCLGEWGVYGNSIFDKNRLQERLQQRRGKPPLKRGYFDYHIKNDVISGIVWVDDVNGYIDIYSDVERGKPYVIGGDTAGEGSDFFTAQVIDNITGKQVSRLKQQFDEDLYANQIYCLGRYYNDALIGIESNYTMTPIKKLQDMEYPKQYVRQQAEDSITHRIVLKYGFHTNSSTRPVILAELVKLVRENVDSIYDEETLDEMLTFVRNEKGRPEAAAGAHDDLVIALAIAQYIRPQQSYSVETDKQENKTILDNFHFTDVSNDGYGEGDKIHVI